MKKGFTLIELLAVIVVLAIIALIALPIVLNIISDSRGNATKRSVEMYLNAVEYAIADIVKNKGGLKTGNYYITEEGDLCTIEKTTNSSCGEENLIKIDVKGEKPKSGVIYVKGGKVNDVTLTLGEKTIVKDEGKSAEDIVDYKVCKLESDTGEKGITPGDRYICKVKPGTDYTFYVLSANEDGTTNLIMDSNINKSGEAVKSNDMEDKGHVAWNLNGENIDGPITAMDHLENATSSWVNLTEMTINTFNDNKGEIHYMKKSYNIYARLPYRSEVNDIGCNILDYDNPSNPSSCPLWMTEYLSNAVFSWGTIEHETPIDGVEGYWTLTSGPVPDIFAFIVGDAGDVSDYDIYDGSCMGVRPVITVKL